MPEPRALNVGVVGATGNVGTVMLQVLAERGIKIGELRAFASERSAGTTATCGEHSAIVEDLAVADPSGLDVALFSAGGDRALEHAPRFVEAGCVVIDNSSAYRMDPAVPLVVPEVNAAAITPDTMLIANPNCSTIQLMVAVKPLADARGLQRMQVTTFQSVSGTGKAAMDELRNQTADALSEREITPAVYPRQIAFNVLPHCDTFDDEGVTKEERKLIDESRKILGLPALGVAATCVRVPVFVSHAEAVQLEFADPLTPADARELLANAPSVSVVDDPATLTYPTPVDATGQDDVLVGRIRRDTSRSDDRGLSIFVVGDNLRKGAATNAVQVLEAMIDAGRFAELARVGPASTN